MTANKQPRITLVGAGPGDADLISVKGLKAIQSADVILYDALVNHALLEHTPKNCLKVFVGKRAGHHSYNQETINLLLIQHAFTKGHVVRLKGGDPFIFGRGHEEIEYARSFGIQTTVIPGISSCIAVPESQLIPLTHRGISQSFWVITGTTQMGDLSDDLLLAAQSSATVVILMGIRKLRQIMGVYAQYGKGEIPAMVIQNGTMDNEKCVVGTVETIADLAEQAEIGTPGIIVIGQVVGLHPTLSIREERSLSMPKSNRA